MKYPTIPDLKAVFVLACIVSGCGSAIAAGCPPIEAAVIKQATTPFHMVMDRDEAGGRHSEMIQTSDTTYMLLRGKWVTVPYNAQERAKDLRDSIGEEQITCQNVGRDNVDGQQTDHYTAQTKNDDGPSNADVWISSSTGLMVKQHIVRTMDGKKTSSDVRLDYTNVTAPPDATPLKR